VLGLWAAIALIGVIVVNRDAILRAKAQFRERCGEPELRLPASAALFPSPRHT
jgi:hypothetical protein